ncbi:MAG: D-alanine--D-alanine ligase [Gammaproteobacteria bacterium]|nr:D-alanine--D-alanine ligase [Gammaproteobacteria bacterium]
MITRQLASARVSDARLFGRVAVLLGGRSAEREISLMTGRAVLDALKRRGVDARAVDTKEDVLVKLMAGGFDRAWIALHGRGGEDGSIQGALQHLGIPFTGSGVLGSALAMDKLRTKMLLEGSGLSTPRYQVLSNSQDCERAVSEIGLPLIIKPANEGSSVGLSKVDTPDQLVPAWRAAAKLDDTVFAEQWISGDEYTAAVVGESVLPIIRIETDNSFYDYQAKYFSDDTRYFCPSGLSEPREDALGALAMRAFRAVDAAGWGRVDFLLDGDKALFLEVNTIPGMTSHSLVPMAAQAAGADFDELAWQILETSLDHSGSGASA